MQDTFFRNKYLIFLLFLLSPMVISIGGEVSPTLLFIAATSPIWIMNIDIKNSSIQRYYVKLFLVIIIVQIIWFPFAKTEDFIQFKGLLITISGLMHFLFFYFVFRYNLSLIKWAILGTFLANFIFVNALAERAGNEYGLWKFHIFPHIVSGCLLIYIWFADKKLIVKLAPILLSLVGVLGIVTGARSAGMAPFIAGMFTLVIQFNKHKIFVKQIVRYIMVVIAVLYGVYAFLYVPNVLNGNIQGGNTMQLKVANNPYNPIHLLMVGRSDAVIPFMAFFDKPLTGWGYMTKDPNRKYQQIQKKIANREERNIIKDLKEKNIPAHSVWGYYSCSYGIIVFVALSLMLFKTWKYVLISLICRDEYLLYRLWGIISVTWNFLFSPMSHFKWSLPSTIAIVLVLSTTAITKYVKDNSRTNECNNITK